MGLATVDRNQLAGCCEAHTKRNALAYFVGDSREPEEPRTVANEVCRGHAVRALDDDACCRRDFRQRHFTDLAPGRRALPCHADTGNARRILIGPPHDVLLGAEFAATIE